VAYPGTSDEQGLCALELASGRSERCHGERCPFWEPSGAVIRPGCALQRLGLDLTHRRELVSALLGAREELEGKGVRDEAWSLFQFLS
jgi:hypothetical protein